jgi:hypothetical protein
MLLYHKNLFILACLCLCVITACSKQKTNTSGEESLSTPTVVIDETIMSLNEKLPAMTADGELKLIQKDTSGVLIEYVMPEEVFMSMYELPESERLKLKSELKSLINSSEMDKLFHQCYETNTQVRIKIIGITSGESFEVEL